MQSHPVRSFRAPPGRWRGWPVLGLALFAAGCASVDVPSPGAHATTHQKTLQSVHHWTVLAQDMAARVAEKMRDWPPGEHALYVESKAETRFNEAFRKLLMARLADLGVPVASEPAGALHLVVEAQVVQHLRADSSALTWVPLASGLSVARDGVHYHGAQRFGAAAAVPGQAATGTTGDQDDTVRTPRLGTPGRSEVLVTASLENGGRYLLGTSDVYSLVHDDALLYLAPQPRPSAPAPPAVKTWQVVSP